MNCTFFQNFHVSFKFLSFVFKVLEYKGDEGRGINLAVLHQGRGVVMTTGTYDVWASTSESEAMRSMLESISDGRILCFFSKVFRFSFLPYRCMVVQVKRNHKNEKKNTWSICAFRKRFHIFYKIKQTRNFATNINMQLHYNEPVTCHSQSFEPITCGSQSREPITRHLRPCEAITCRSQLCEPITRYTQPCEPVISFFPLTFR